MYKRTWTPTEICDKTPVSNITIYDGGAFWGELIGTEWRCWEVVSRECDEQSRIVEMLIPMNVDWVPYDVFRIESYPVYESSSSEMLIDGWKIEYLTISQPAQRQPQQAQQRPQQAQKSNRASGQPLAQGSKERTTMSPPLKASGGQKRHGQNSRQYQEPPVKYREQTWTPLVQIAHQETPRANQPPPPSKQMPSSPPQTFHERHSPSQQRPQQSSARHRNPNAHRHNTP